MRIGITGAKGFIGKHLVSALKKRGTVVTLPRRKGLSGKRELKQFVTDPVNRLFLDPLQRINAFAAFVQCFSFRARL